MIKRIPNVNFQVRVRDDSIEGDNPFKWETKSTDDYFGNKKVILFSLPGAFTPTCSTFQLPDFNKLYDDFKKFNPSKDNLILDKVIKKLSDNNFEDEDKLGLCFQEFCQENDLKFKDFGPVVRFGLTGRLKAPAINEICFLLGKTRTIDRLNNFQIFMSNNAVASNE